MADLGAVERAAAGPEQMAPMQEAAPAGGDPMQILAGGMQAINAFIGSQAEQGNPGAEAAMAAFTQLVEAMKIMAGGEPPEAQPVEGQQPLETGQTVI